MKVAAAGMITALALVFCLGSPQAGEKKSPKYTIKNVMKLAHKDGLLKKVLSGKASKEEKERLAELYVSLSESKPPRGDAEAWREVTAEIVVQAKAAARGEKTASKLLQKATNCAGCHKRFKG